MALYERHALAWDAARSGVPVESSWLDRFRSAMAPRGEILDLGCGSGEPLAGTLIRCGHRVTGVDASPSLLRMAAERFPDQTWIEHDMRSLALGVRFAGIIAWDSFFHLPRDDQRAMFAIFRAHAAPEAALLFTSGPSDGEAIGMFEGEPLYHASLAADAYRALLAENGFEVMQYVPEDETCGGHTVWLAKLSQDSRS
ncbi:class I SAM-dependent DNA methyltransferase [Hyphomicrobium nitrativorans]|uniref:class I SAM-dependent DNA methyltransferase n=1 Tax=Hyphomicrobium nitrativorans TaxID=1427356 RepID=UPI00059BD712|nr:class I SAM-dependent methyltransferase [Hyphomicrobium nitrativorans]